MPSSSVKYLAVLSLFLIAAICMAGCTEQPVAPARNPATPPQGGLTGTQQAAGCPDIRVSGPGSLTWISEPPAGSANAALVSGAKELMKGIYTYPPGAPDYLPSSYTDQKSSNTAYIVHAANPGNVSWAPAGETQVVWKSSPGGLPKGWSGVVTTAGQAPAKAAPEPIHVMTDCSGFITSLFTWANTQTATQFTGWKTGSTIPEAGCFNPAGACNEPAPLNYYHLFTTGQGGFRSISLEDLQPGDLIAYANTKDRSDSGHIMLVTAVSSCTGDQQSRFVVITDETGSPHSNDTRTVKTLASGEKTGAGLGMGIIRLTYTPADNLRFYWGLSGDTPQTGSIALGRAL